MIQNLQTMDTVSLDKKNISVLQIVSKRLSARSVELKVREKKGVQRAGQNQVDANILDEQSKLESILGLKVNIFNKKNNSGKVVIEYKDLDQFQFISELLKKN